MTPRNVKNSTMILPELTQPCKIQIRNICLLFDVSKREKIPNPWGISSPLSDIKFFRCAILYANLNCVTWQIDLTWLKKTSARYDLMNTPNWLKRFYSVFLNMENKTRFQISRDQLSSISDRLSSLSSNEAKNRKQPTEAECYRRLPKAGICSSCYLRQ